MSDPRVANLAKILVNYSTKVQPGDWVLVSANVVAEPLTLEVAREVVRAGGRLNILQDSDDVNNAVMEVVSEEQLQWISPLEKMLYNEVDVIINLRATTNTRVNSGIDPSKTRLRSQARSELLNTYLQRAADGDLRWVLTQFPCHAYAQDADMSLRDYEDFVYKATFADQPDPIQHWQNIHDEQQRMVEWLEGKKQVVVRGPNSDLTLSIEGRPFKNSDGRNNMPSGEIFTSPVENSANGWIRFTYPAIHEGREVEGIELEFKEGKVVSAKAEKNEDFLISLLDTDPGARYLGEFAVGTNYGIQKFTKSILFDEKIGGSIHLAVGTGFPDTKSQNRSAIHWDMICDMRDNSEILVDGELFYKNGKFVV